MLHGVPAVTLEAISGIRGVLRKSETELFILATIKELGMGKNSENNNQQTAQSRDSLIIKGKAGDIA